MMFIATLYHVRECFHFVMYSVLWLYEIDVILLFDQYLFWFARKKNMATVSLDIQRYFSYICDGTYCRCAGILKKLDIRSGSHAIDIP